MKDDKVFVVDTNVLIHNPEALLSFRDTEVILPLWVLEELDSLKTYPDQRGRAAREAIRFIDTVSRTGSGNLNDGVHMPNGSMLRVALDHAEVPSDSMPLDVKDNKIILTAYALMRAGRKVFFVSKDINARVKATALGIKAVDYAKQTVDISTLYAGLREIDVGQDVLPYLDALDESAHALREAESIEITGYSSVLSGARKAYQDAHDAVMALPVLNNLHLQPNEYLVMHEKGDSEFLLRWNGERLDPVEPRQGAICGVHPLNIRQRIALELLLDDSVNLVTLVGKAGTGKTLLAIAAGLKKVLEDKTYSKLLISRPVVPVGKDIGYLPGEKTAKMSNWMAPVFDNLDYILSVYKRQNLKSSEQLFKDKLIEIEAVSFIRGRSLPRQYIIIDEAQNLTPHEMKTIVSRAGEGSKVVISGDPYQIDNIYLDSNSNGLSYLVDRFKGQKIFGHVTFQKSERSQLAELAAELL